MFRALSVLTRWWFVPFLGAVLPAMSAHVATAQSWADSTAHYAEWQTPKEKPFSLHLHGGLFSRVDLNAPSPTVGLRLSRVVSSYLQAGVLTGWTMERKDETERVSSRPGPAPRLLLSRVDAHLVPLMGFLRVNLTEKSWFVPYAGAGAGYEWLKLQATDYRTQVVSTATFSNWAWEGWGGVGIRLGKNLRLNGEAFYNGATLSRDLVDENDVIRKELVYLDGVGVRFGIDIIFQ